ncbi:MAG: triose-phosphate isomerase [Planctomycetota bacterium]
MRTPFIAGNWKMNTGLEEALNLSAGIRDGLKGLSGREAALCPPYVYVAAVRDALKGSEIRLGAQNGYFQPQGAFTGEVSFAMLKDIGCEYAIIGHSERRQIFKEDNDVINKKIKAALAAGLKPIFCVGELLEERQENTTERVIRHQVEAGLDDISSDNFQNIIVAYEPVWAIGTGKNATPEQAQEVHSFIRKLLAHLSGETVARDMRIIYGGSVKADNIEALSAQEDIDGALVGGASLNAESFIKIVNGTKIK